MCLSYSCSDLVGDLNSVREEVYSGVNGREVIGTVAVSNRGKKGGGSFVTITIEAFWPGKFGPIFLFVLVAFDMLEGDGS